MLEVKRALEKFARNVVKFSRSNLTKKNKNVSKELYNSIGYDLRVHPKSFSLTFEMEEYGAYQDKGVSGVKKKYNTPFSYKSKMPPEKPILDWINKRRLRLRNKETGRFTKGGQKSLAFVIRRSIYNKGIKPSLFFTKPFEASFKHLPDELVEAYGLTIDNILTK